MHTACIVDEDGTENFVALILRNDNPAIIEIVTEFVTTASVLQNKPDVFP